MDRMDEKKAITDIVESMLPNWSGNQIGLKMTLNIDGASHIDGNFINRTDQITFIFIRSMNYTKVFARKHNFKEVQKDNEWKVYFEIADHDSCWNEFSIITDTYFEVCNTVNPNARPIDVTVRMSFDIFDGAPHYVEVETKNMNKGTYERAYKVKTKKLDPLEGMKRLVVYHEAKNNSF